MNTPEEPVQKNTVSVSGTSYGFSLCPDCWIRLDHVLEDGGLVLAVGEAGGTIDAVPWHTPAAWKAVVRGGLLHEWRVFADNKPVYEILARPKA